MPIEMKNPYIFKRLLRFSAFSLLVFSFSCKKETQPDYARFPVELTTVDVINGVKLSWTKVETSDFVDYTIVRSTGDSIPELNQLAANPSAFVVARIGDAKLTTFTDIRNTSVATRTFYRVFARLSGRNVSSKNVLINADIVDLGTGFTEIIGNNSKDKPRFYMSGSFSNSILAYDATDSRIVAINTTSLTANMRLAVASKNGVNEEVAAYTTGTSSISFFDAETLKSTGTLALTGGSPIVASIGTVDGFFIFVTSETTNNIKIVNLTTHTVSQATISFTVTLFSGCVLTKNPASRELFLRDPNQSSSRICRIEYNAQGQILDGGLLGFVNILFMQTPVLRVSAGGDLFMVSSTIFNRSLQAKASFSTSAGGSYADFYFSAAGNKIYALTFGSSIASNIDEYDATSFKFTQSIPTKVAGLRCFTTENALIIFSNGNSTGRTNVQKIKI